MSAARLDRLLSLFTVTCAAAGIVIAVLGFVVFVRSPLSDPSLTPSAAVQNGSADALFLTLVGAAVCVLAIASVAATWSTRRHLLVRSLAGVGATVGGAAAALTLDPQSESLQARFMIYLHGDGPVALGHQFTVWIQQLSALSWAYAACGAGVLAAALVATAVCVAGRRRASSPAGDLG